MVDLGEERIDAAATPLYDLDRLDRRKQSAFLALFAGARSTAQVARVGNAGRVIRPMFGKAECDCIEEWHDFYSRELPGIGFTTFSETEPREALGMEAGSTCWQVTVAVTDRGRAAREAYWERLRWRGAGYDAYLAGDQLAECPHAADSFEANAWRAGWNCAAGEEAVRSD